MNLRTLCPDLEDRGFFGVLYAIDSSIPFSTSERMMKKYICAEKRVCHDWK